MAIYVFIEKVDSNHDCCRRECAKETSLTPSISFSFSSSTAAPFPSSTGDLFRITFDELYLGQKQLVLMMFRSAESKKSGRKQATLAKRCLGPLCHSEGALKVAGASHDALFAIAQYVKAHGEDPV